jgi:hypothetical protein
MLSRVVACAVLASGALGLAPAAARAPSVQSRFRFAGVRSDASGMAPDGRGGFLVAGQVRAGDAADSAVARLTAAGRLTGTGTIVAGGPRDEQVRGLAAIAGNAFVAGCADTPSGGCAGFVAKVLPDGTLDAGFGTAGLAHVDTNTRERAFQALDGVLPARGGRLTVVGEDGRGVFVARLMADGTRDRAFGLRRPFPAHHRFFVDDVTADGRGGAVILGSVVVSGSAPDDEDTRVFALGIGRVGRDGRPRPGFGNHGLRLLRNRPLRGLPHYEFGVRVALRRGRLIVVSTDPRDRPVVARLHAASGTLAGPRWFGARPGEQSEAAVDRRGRAWVAVSTGRRTLVWRIGTDGSPTRRTPVTVSTGDRHEIVRGAVADRSGRLLLAVTDSGFGFFSGVAIARVTP